MAGIEDVQPKAINTGIQLVGNPDLSATSTPAVDALVNAFKNGLISSQEIMDRIGPLAQEKKIAEGANARLSAATSTAGMDLVEPLKKAALAKAALSTAQAGSDMSLIQPLASEALAKSALGTTQANAQAGLVQPAAALTREQINKKRETLNSEAFTDAWLKYRMPINKVDAEGNDTGEPDYKAMAQGGYKYLQMERSLSFAQQGLTGQRTVIKDPKTNQDRAVILNPMGEDITPTPPGAPVNKTRKYYEDMRQEAWGILHSINPSDPEPTRAKVSSADVAPKGGEASAALAKPVVDAGAPGDYEPYSGNAAGMVPGTSVPEVLDRLKNTQQYQDWTEKLIPMRNFQNAAAGVHAPGGEKVLGFKVMNQKDTALILAVQQLASQSAAASARGMPDLQSHALEENVSRLEKLEDFPSVLAGTGKLTDGTRERLIALGNDYIKAKEQTVKPILNWAATTSGADAADLFGPDSDAERIIKGGSMTYQTPGGHGGAPEAGKLIQVGGRTLRSLGNGQYQVVQ